MQRSRPVFSIFQHPRVFILAISALLLLAVVPSVNAAMGDETSPKAAGTQPASQPAPAQAGDAREGALHPAYFVCPPKVDPPRRPIPPGKKIDDLCPPGTNALLFFGSALTTGPALINAKSFACFPQFHQQPRPVPPGKKTADLCPSGGSAWIFFGEPPEKSTESTPGETPVPQTPAATSKKSP
jgi:hypothetical protein